MSGATFQALLAAAAAKSPLTAANTANAAIYVNASAGSYAFTSFAFGSTGIAVVGVSFYSNALSIASVDIGGVTATQIANATFGNMSAGLFYAQGVPASGTVTVGLSATGNIFNATCSAWSLSGPSTQQQGSVAVGSSLTGSFAVPDGSVLFAASQAYLNNGCSETMSVPGADYATAFGYNNWGYTVSGHSNATAATVTPSISSTTANAVAAFGVASP